MILVVPLAVVTESTFGAGIESFPFPTKSIPRPPFEKIELRSTVSPFVAPFVSSTTTPALPLKAIVFAAAAPVPPTVFPSAPIENGDSGPAVAARQRPGDVGPDHVALDLRAGRAAFRDRYAVAAVRRDDVLRACGRAPDRRVGCATGDRDPDPAVSEPHGAARVETHIVALDQRCTCSSAVDQDASSALPETTFLVAVVVPPIRVPRRRRL